MTKVVPVAIAALAGILAACASPPANTAATPAKSPPATPAGSEFAARLARARAMRGTALIKAVPLYTGAPDDKRARLAFAHNEVRAWFDETRGKVDGAHEAYAAALDVAPSPSDRATVMSDAADLDVVFTEHFLAANREAMPSSWKKDAEIAQAFERTAFVAAERWRTRATRGLTACAALATPDKNRCDPIRQRFAVIEDRMAERPPPSRATTKLPPAACEAGDATCSPGPKTRKPPPTAPGGCKCPPADPLCSCQ